MTAKKKGTELEVLFPETTVQGIVVKPISLLDLPKVIDAFGKVLQLADQGVHPTDIALRGLRELLLIMPYCIDRPAEEIPSPVVPELIQVMLDQNLNEETVGKWTSLLQRATALQVEAAGQAEKKEASKG